MYLQNWTKTIFSTYNICTKLIGTLDKMIKIRALSSMSKNFNEMAKNSTEVVCKDINILSAKQCTLKNLKTLVETLLKMLPEKHARFMILKYIEDKTFNEIAQILDTSIRTIFRWHNEAVLKCSFALRRMGFDGKKMLAMFEEEKWLMQIYKEFLAKKIESVCAPSQNEQKLMKNIYAEYRRVICR